MATVSSLIAVGIVLRLVFLITSAKHPADPRFVADPYAYLLMAEHAYHGRFFVSFRGYPTSYLSVGYPAIIAVVQRIVLGLVSTWVVALALNVLAFVATATAMVRLVPVFGRRMGLSRPALDAAVLCAVGILAVYPDFVFATGLVMTELISVAFLSWGLVLVGRIIEDARSSQHRGELVLGSLLIGLSVFVRPSMLLLVLVCPAFLWWRAGWRRSVVSLSVILVPVLPLAWNNSRVGAGAGVTSATWMNVCDGLVNRRGEFEWRRECRTTILPGESIGPRTEARNTEWARKISLLEIRNRPGFWVSRMPLRLWHSLWSGGWATQFSVRWGQNYVWTFHLRSFLWLSRVFFAIVAALGILQVARLVKDRRLVWWPSVIVVVGSLSGVLVSFGQSRFGWPLAVLVFVPHAALLVGLWFTRRSHRPNSLEPVMQ